jgi:hypothetical protein
VSKSNVTSYLRCPYAFYLIDSGALSPADAIDALGERLIEEGVAFEASITAQAVPLLGRTCNVHRPRALPHKRKKRFRAFYV